MASEAQLNTLQQLYIAYFGRPAEPAGVTYWEGRIDAGMTLDEVANSFTSADEFVAKYGDDTAALVRAAYQNALGREVESEAALTFWVEQLESGDVTPADLMNSFFGTSDATDLAVLNNRTEVAKAYTAAAGENYDAAASAALLASVDDAQASVDAALEQVPGVPSEAFTLTAGVDTVAGDAAANTIEGVSSALSSARTLDAADKIDGGAGVDTLKVNLQSSFAGFSGDGFLKNVENVELTNSNAIARDFSAKGVEGVQSFNLVGAVNLADLAATGAAVNLADRATGTTTIAYTAKAVEGSADALALGLSNIGTAQVKNAEGVETTAQAAVTVTALGIEELALTAKGVNVVALGADDAKSVTVAGDGSLKLTDVGTALKTLDASAQTGKLDVDLGAATGVTSVKTGSADDLIRAAAGDLAINAVVNGGAGVDTLALTGNIGTVQYEMSGVETVELNGATTLFSASKTSGVEKVTVKGTGNGASFANMGTANLSIGLVEGATGSLSSDNSGSVALGVTGGTKDAATSTSVATTLTKASSVELNVAQYNTLTGNVTASKAQSLVANIAGDVKNTITLDAATSAVINQTNKDSTKTSTVIDLEAAKLLDLTVNAVGAMALTDSTLSGLESLVVSTAKEFDGAAVNLGKVSSVTLSGAGAAAKVVLGSLGTETLEYGVTVKAEGLAAGLNIDDIEAGVGQAINVDVSKVLGNVVIADVEIDGKNETSLSGSVTINANGTAGTVSIAEASAKTVTINAAGALGEVSVGSVDIAENTGAEGIEGESVSFIGSALKANTVYVTASKEATLVGGINNDTFMMVASSKSGEVAKFTVTGGLGNDKFLIDYNETLAGKAIVTITDFNAGDTTNIATATLGAFSGVSGDTAEAKALKLLVSSGVVASTATNADGVVFLDLNGDNDASVFTYGGNTYAVAGAVGSAETTTADATFGNGEILIVLSGVQSAAAINTAFDIAV